VRPSRVADIVPKDGRNRHSIHIFNKSRRAEIATPTSPGCRPMRACAWKMPGKIYYLRDTHVDNKVYEGQLGGPFS
jgi:hypothetical protein